MVVERVAPYALLLSFVCNACSGSQPPAEAERDLTLPPAESIAVISDEPLTDEPLSPRRAETPTEQPVEERPVPAKPRPAPQEPSDEAEPELALRQGTTLELAAADTIRSRMSVVGDPVTATTFNEVVDEQGRVLIPVGAVFTGTITQIESAGSPGGVGTMILSFSEVHFGGATYPILAESDSLGFEMKGQGVSGGDAAKVGAGAVVGAIAGRVVGKNAKGAVIGGVVGAATGAAVAAATKDQDIVLPAGGYIRIVLTQPLVLGTGG